MNNIATHFEMRDAFAGLKSTKNKKLQQAYQTIIYCCQDIQALREKVDKYEKMYGD